MNLTFIYSPGFVREWARLRLGDSDLQALEAEIAQAPEVPPIMKGTGGLRKIRFAPPSRHQGKSGANRIAFAYFRAKAAIIVVAVLSKNESANFTPAQRQEIGKWLKQFEENYR